MPDRPRVREGLVRIGDGGASLASSPRFAPLLFLGALWIEPRPSTGRRDTSRPGVQKALLDGEVNSDDPPVKEPEMLSSIYTKAHTTRQAG